MPKIINIGALAAAEATKERAAARSGEYRMTNAGQDAVELKRPPQQPVSAETVAKYAAWLDRDAKRGTPFTGRKNGWEWVIRITFQNEDGTDGYAIGSGISLEDAILDALARAPE